MRSHPSRCSAQPFGIRRSVTRSSARLLLRLACCGSVLAFPRLDFAAPQTAAFGSDNSRSGLFGAPATFLRCFSLNKLAQTCSGCGSAPWLVACTGCVASCHAPVSLRFPKLNARRVFSCSAVGKNTSASLKDSRHRAFLSIVRKDARLRLGFEALRREFFRPNSLTPAHLSPPCFSAAPGTHRSPPARNSLHPRCRNGRSAQLNGVARHGSGYGSVPAKLRRPIACAGSTDAWFARALSRSQSSLLALRLTLAPFFAPVLRSKGCFARAAGTLVCASPGSLVLAFGFPRSRSCSSRSGAPRFAHAAPGSLGLARAGFVESPWLSSLRLAQKAGLFARPALVAPWLLSQKL